MNEMTELKEATTQWVNKANQVFGRTFPMPLLSLKIRGGCAGRAYCDQWMIKYNPEIYIRNREAFIKRTVPHELAHLITHTLYGRVKSHGREWRHVMHKLEVQDVTRCHSYDVTGIKKQREKPFVYACNCQEFHLSSLIHRKILMGRNRRCMKCGTIVVFKRIEVAS